MLVIVVVNCMDTYPEIYIVVFIKAGRFLFVACKLQYSQHMHPNTPLAFDTCWIHFSIIIVLYVFMVPVADTCIITLNL